MSNFEDQWYELGAVSLPPIKSVKALPFYTPIPIQNAEVKRARFGEKILLTCKDFVVFLPERFSSLPPKAVEHIASGGYKLIKHQSEGDNYTINLYIEEGK